MSQWPLCLFPRGILHQLADNELAQWELGSSAQFPKYRTQWFGVNVKMLRPDNAWLTESLRMHKGSFSKKIARGRCGDSGERRMFTVWLASLRAGAEVCLLCTLNCGSGCIRPIPFAHQPAEGRERAIRAFRRGLVLFSCETYDISPTSCWTWLHNQMAAAPSSKKVWLHNVADHLL